MAWTLEFSEIVERQLRKLDPVVARRILKFLEERVAPASDPRSLGKAMQGALAGTWAYRVGHYRVLCTIEDHRIVVIVVDVGHRGDIYR